MGTQKSRNQAISVYLYSQETERYSSLHAENPKAARARGAMIAVKGSEAQ
jgi:hypothetical protein